jgi:hypothetical protein
MHGEAWLGGQIPANSRAAKDTAKITQGKLPVRGYHELVAHPATLTRNTVSLAGKRFEKLCVPAPEQRAFELLGKPTPLSLDGTLTAVATNGGAD